jgi:hypothetical protein
MSTIGSLPPLACRPLAPSIPELSPEQLFDQASKLTGSSFRGEPLGLDVAPADVVMGAIANFGGDANISDFERGVLLNRVIEMKSDGQITQAEASNFANEVEGMRTGLVDYRR